MTSEACPFCGKLFKRLKAHLPHCKAAGHTKPPPASHNVLAKTPPLPTSPSRDATAEISPLPPSYSAPLSRLSDNTTKKSKMLAQASPTASPARKSKKDLSSPAPTPPTPVSKEVLSFSSSSTGSVLPSTSKKKKLKLADQIKMAAQSSSFADSMPSSTSHSVSPNPSLAKPQKKSLRAIIEASRSKLVPGEKAESDKSTSLDQISASTANSVEVELLSSVSSGSHTGAEVNISDASPMSTSLKSKGIARKKGSSPEKRGASPSVAKASATSQEDLDVGASESSGTIQQQNRSRLKFWEDVEEEVPVKENSRGSESYVQTRVTLQHVRATVGRSKASKQASKPASTMDQIEIPPVQTYDILTSKTKTTQNETKHFDILFGSVAKPGQSLSTNPKASDPSVLNPESTIKYTKSKEGSLVSHLIEDSLQPKTALLLSPVCAPLSAHTSSLVALSAPLGSLVNPEQGLSVGRNKMEPVTASQSASHLMERTAPPSISSFSSSSLSSLKLPVRAEERQTLAKSLHEIAKPKIAEQGNKGVLTDLSLGQVRLRDVPEWLALKMPSHPREAVQMVHRGWKWYYRRYINVRKGGVGGVAMLLGGYCVLSYIWSYPHIKQDRWRKYH